MIERILQVIRLNHKIFFDESVVGEVLKKPRFSSTRGFLRR